MAKRTDIPKRSEVDPVYQWHLSDIYADTAAWESDFKKAQALMKDMESRKGTLAGGRNDVLKALKTFADLNRVVERLVVYAFMKKDEDNANTESQAHMDRAQSLSVQAGTAASWLTPELLTIPADTLTGYMEDSDFAEYSHFLDNVNRQRSHTLGEKEEQLLAMAGEVAEAPRQVFLMLNNADMKFPVIKDEEGHEVEMSHGRYIRFLESKDRSVRRAAYEAMYDTFAKQKNTISTAYSYSVKKDLFLAKARKYPSARAMSLDEDNVPETVYDNLIASVRDHLPALQRYLDIRRRVLGLPKLSMYDVYVPLMEDVHMHIPYDEGKGMILDGLSKMGSDYAGLLKESYTGGWIDVMENQGKTSGAYSWGCYDSHPYVLMNYQDTVDSVFTLAHELGHSMHTYLSNQHQPYMKAEYTIFVAEVASTCNEIQLTHYLLDTLDDKAKRAYILNHYLEQVRTTVFRQTMFAEFEKMSHASAEAGEPLTVDSMSSMYRKLNEDYFGENVDVDDRIAMEWLRIPHFYRPFYVYKYATGFSAAAALAGMIRDEGQSAVDRYLTFLSSGCSDYPIDLLKKAGVDMTTPAPVDKALDEFSELVDEMDGLLS
mgnify:FL=1